MDIYIMKNINIRCFNSCRHRPTHAQYYRLPNKYELSEGVPEWFNVYIDNYTVEYVTQDGQRFQSIYEVRKWRTHGPFEDMGGDIPSF